MLAKRAWRIHGRGEDENTWRRDQCIRIRQRLRNRFLFRGVGRAIISRTSLRPLTKVKGDDYF